MKWEARCMTAHHKKWIAVIFERNATWIERIKQIEGARWSGTDKAWLVPDTPGNRDRFKLTREAVLSDEHEARVGKFRSWLRSKWYSSNTEKVETEALPVFLLRFNERDPADLEKTTSFNSTMHLFWKESPRPLIRIRW